MQNYLNTANRKRRTKNNERLPPLSIQQLCGRCLLLFRPRALVMFR